MALTLQERNTCRDLLAEIKFNLVSQEDEVVSTNNSSIVRFIAGIGEPLQDQCQQFLKTFVSAKNPEVVLITGTTTPYDVSGEYFGTGSTVNGYDQRKAYDGDYWLEVSESAGNYRWIIRNEWNDVLYRSQEQVDSPVDLGDAIWEAVEVSFQFSAERESMIVPEVAVVVDDTATFTCTGAITAEEQLPDTGIYATVLDPLADIQVRDGLWRGGRVWTEKQNNGTFTLFQALYVLNESSAYILSGKTVSAYHTEERRLYERIPEANVNDLVNSLASLSGYTVVDVDVRLTNNRGIYNVSLRLREYTGPVYVPGDPIGGLLVGCTGGLFATNSYLIRHVPEDELDDLIADLKAMDLVQNVRASQAEEGYWNVSYTVLVLPAVRIEYEVGHERRESGSGATGWIYFNNHTPKYDSQGNLDWQLFLDRKPTAYNQSASWREVSNQQTVSYSAADPGVINASFSGYTSTGGKKRQLQNGIWEKRVIVISKLWW